MKYRNLPSFQCNLVCHDYRSVALIWSIDTLLLRLVHGVLKLSTQGMIMSQAVDPECSAQAGKPRSPWYLNDKSAIKFGKPIRLQRSSPHRQPSKADKETKRPPMNSLLDLEVCATYPGKQVCRTLNLVLSRAFVGS